MSSGLKSLTIKKIRKKNPKKLSDNSYKMITDTINKNVHDRKGGMLNIMVIVMKGNWQLQFKS